jgi:hypothetical protein
LQNLIAQGALLAWPLVALGCYMMMPAGRATIWTLLAGYLLLPVAVSFDLPAVPAFDKSTIPNLAAIILAPIMARKGEFRWPRSKGINLLMLLFVLVPFGTAMTNGDVLTVGSVTLPSMGFREGLSSAVGQTLEVIPFLLGAALLGHERGHRDLLVAFVVAALLYSLPILAEIRLSPFLQARVYGVSQADYFIQQIRFGGFRSMMFLGHGLLVSTFCAMAFVAAIGLWRMRMTMLSLPMAAIASYLFVVLVLNKSVGSILLIALVVPLFLFLRTRMFLILSAGLALLLVTYPAVRTTHLLPFEGFARAVAVVSPDRSESWQFRLRNEDMLLARAQLRPLFGWGTFGRNRVIVVTSWGSTTDASVTDGTWIITLGTFGWLGYLATFGLLALPFWRAFRLRRMALPTATLAVLAIHLINLLDLIPNSSLRPITWLIAGALAGVAVVRVRASARRPAAMRTPPVAGPGVAATA